ncbi:AI-2E family transporter [Hyphobacterium sp. HN65]|uniref:AI-2E family transporter n=1 Tax=Hyphobacterium lacteum TaxID=3116575 RepID=A0ABU7LR26_9PROT|nr:AI-2E family transporter [Hyphobacterium sp. HN65]MEE2526363.1 AI-2E family transporter [Hyphobacterium sp. HN65]
MKLTLDARFAFVALLVLALAWALRAAGDVLLPFLLAGFLAVILEPLTRRMCKMGAPRFVAALISTLIAVLIIAGPIVAIMPIVIIEGRDLIARLPALIDNLLAGAHTLAGGMGLELPEISLQTFTGDTNPVQAIGSRVARSVSGAISGVLLTFLTPVALFFFLKDWPGISKTLGDLPPRRYSDELRRFGRETNIQLSRYVRGQSLVIIVQAIYHAAALAAVGLNYSVAIGILTGLSAIIPVVGNLVMFSLAMLVAISQYDSIWPILAVVAVYGTAQILETVWLAPKLVGGQLKLHPLWIMAGLLIGGALFGFLGALLALPMVAVGSVVAKHGLEIWRNSEFYKQPDPSKTAK